MKVYFALAVILVGALTACQWTVTPDPIETTTTTIPQSTWEPEFPGDVQQGYVRWGAAIGGNSAPERHEAHTTKALGLRRTYWRWDQRTTAMIRTATDDLSVGRLPWVSVKTPGWAQMASGALDREIDQMLNALGGLDGPVWLTVHHEPEGNGPTGTDEGEGGIPNWRAMQVRIRERIKATQVKNVAFAPILMSWTFDPRSNRVPESWWVDGIWDFAGIDHYQDKETAATVISPRWLDSVNFFTSKGVKIAVGEWGNKGTDSVAAREMQEFYDFGISSGSGPGQIIGFAYFDSNLNSSKGGWELFGQPLARFRSLMDVETSLLAKDSA